MAPGTRPLEAHAGPNGCYTSDNSLNRLYGDIRRSTGVLRRWNTAGNVVSGEQKSFPAWVRYQADLSTCIAKVAGLSDVKIYLWNPRLYMPLYPLKLVILNIEDKDFYLASYLRESFHISEMGDF